MIGKKKLTEYCLEKVLQNFTKAISFPRWFFNDNKQQLKGLCESCHVALVCLRIAQTSMSVL